MGLHDAGIGGSEKAAVSSEKPEHGSRTCVSLWFNDGLQEFLTPERGMSKCQRTRLQRGAPTGVGVGRPPSCGSRKWIRLPETWRRGLQGRSAALLGLFSLPTSADCCRVSPAFPLRPGLPLPAKTEAARIGPTDCRRSSSRSGATTSRFGSHVFLWELAPGGLQGASVDSHPWPMLSSSSPFSLGHCFGR